MKIYLAYIGKWEADCYGYHLTKRGAVRRCIEVLNQRWMEARDRQIEDGKLEDRRWKKEDPTHNTFSWYDGRVDTLRYDMPWFVCEAEVED
jgi:hypothetical protein